MRLREHLQISRDALRSWLIGQCWDALMVGVLWFVGLLLIGVPLAWLWAVFAAVLQLIPIVGTALALVGPTIAALIGGGVGQMLYVLILYAGIALIDGLILQPYIFKQTAKVPVWASIVAPLALGAFFNVWGVVLSVPLLVVVYAYRARRGGLE